MQEQKLLKNKRKALLEGNRHLLASICIDLAEMYFRNENYEKAIEEYVTVAEVYNETGKLIDYAQVNRMIGEAYTHLKNYEAALNYQKIHLSIAEEQNNKLEQQRALATIGHTYLTSYLDIENNTERSLLNLAHKYFMKSLYVCEKLQGIKKQEHKDMTARLLANLGIVHENLQEYDRGIDLLQKSINICKGNDLFEQLERGYTCLGVLYVHKKDYDKAINQFNLALEVAGRLKNKNVLICNTLLAKADVLIKLADFRGAKPILLKAYKLKSKNDGGNIERNLKIISAMCKAEDTLLVTDDSDYKTKKELYEKLGDGASALKASSSALEYYKKMLEAAQCVSDIDLSPCYTSLAETYVDMKLFGMAIEYYKKDYDVCKPFTRGAIISLLNTADCMEALNKDLEEIDSVYKQARKESKISNEKHLECKILSRHIKLLRNNEKFSDLAILEHDLAQLKGGQLETDSEPSEDQEEFCIGDDIAISDITDESEDSDVESSTIKQRNSRRYKKGLQIKKNNKGETQLHQACISGNTELVKRLLEAGHPVNVRDNCGWLPIHEASNYGYIEIVKLLLDKGALINDKGGKLCNGMTPLHDAAGNGHLEIIQLLLDKGASAIAKNSCGEMPLHILKKWKQSEGDLYFTRQELYDDLVNRLSKSIEKLGHSKDIIIPNENIALVSNETSVFQVANTSYKNQIGNLRRIMSFDEDMLPLSNNSNSGTKLPETSIEEETNAGNEYRRVIESLRHPLKEVNVERKRKSGESPPKSAYIQTDEVGDDWLEDDIGMKHNKKAKVNSVNTFITTSGIRRTSSSSLKSSSNTSLKSTADASNSSEISESESNIKELYADNEDILLIGSDNDSNYKIIQRKKKRQSSLIDNGFTKHRSFSPTDFANRNGDNLKRKSQTKLVSHTHSMNDFDESVSQIVNSEPTWSVNVRIENKLYKISVLSSEIQTKTIRWLADEAAKLYSRKEWVEPILELETKTGAILANDDFLSILFINSSNQSEEVEARILKWNLPPFTERYNEACNSLNIEPDKDITKIVQKVSTSLDLANHCLDNTTMTVMCKIINRQININYINFSGNVLLNDTFLLFITSLVTLDNLTTLDLSLTNLTSCNLEILADTFTQSSRPILTSLINLNLSYNPLGDESFRYLAILTRFLKLQMLRLTSVDFTNEIFDTVSNRDICLCLDYTTDFDIGYNQLRKEQLNIFLSWLNPENVSHLNLSNTAVTEEGFVKNIVEWLQKNHSNHLKLKSLNLSRCFATDMEVADLLRVLQLIQDFSSLDLSHNEGLTSISLRRLIQHYPSFENLELTGCKNIFKYFNECSLATWDIINLKSIKITYDTQYMNEKEILIKAWKSRYQEKANILEVIPGFINLFISH